MITEKTKDVAEKDKDSTNDMPKIYRLFLYFESVVIFIYIPLMLLQIYVTLNYFLFVNSEVTKFHYYHVTQLMVTPMYPVDFYPDFIDKAQFQYNSTYLSNCTDDYSYDGLLIFGKVKNVELIDITDTLEITDPDFPDEQLDAKNRGFKFYKYDISTPPTDPSKATEVEFSSKYIFNFWKGKRYCRKNIYFDENFNVLQIIDWKTTCAKEFQGYNWEDCGSYYNNSYRLCALKDFAYDTNMNPYISNEEMMNSNSSICPITNIRFEDHLEGGRTMIPISKNLQNQSGVIKDEVFLIVFDWIKFKNSPKTPLGNSTILDDDDGTSIQVDINQTYGLFNDMNFIIDEDDFMNFYSYSTDLFIYYKNFMNGTNNDFYMPFTSRPVKVIMSLYVIKSFSTKCFRNVFQKRNEKRLQGLAKELDVSDLFGYVLTTTVWIVGSLFVGVYYGLNIRIKFIRMKLYGTLVLNNKRSEEISKFTNKLFWFFAFLVKFGLIIQMIATSKQQISIVSDFITYKCFDDSLLDTLRVNLSFLGISLLISYDILILLLIEFCFEMFICIGYLFIFLYNNRRAIYQKILLEEYKKALKEE